MTEPVEQIAARLERLHPQADRPQPRSAARRCWLVWVIPEQRLPPVIHVAGTNGKGSTCAFIRAMAEAAGLRVHVYTSPHLVRFNERIRIAGELVPDDRLIATMEHIERINDNAPITVFEVITAAAFRLFAETPADLCILEVGLGGRGDSTNVIEPLLPARSPRFRWTIAKCWDRPSSIIAAEKAGIMKPGVPVAIGAQPDEVRASCSTMPAGWTRRCSCAAATGKSTPTATGLRYTDAAGTPRHTRARRCPGLFQHDNAGIALAALRASGSPVTIPPGWRTPNGRRGCSGCTDASPRCCRRTGSCGWMAATTRAPASCWRNICAAGPTGRCIWSSG